MIKTLIKIIIIFTFLLIIGYASLPFILAAALGLNWIKVFAIITIPSAVITIGIIGIQIKLFYSDNGKKLFKFKKR